MIDQTQRRLRSGISLIEVIACMVLVAIMILPLAGVIRASGQSMVQAEGSGTTQSNLRVALSWLQSTIRHGEILGTDGKSLKYFKNGKSMKTGVSSGRLIVDDGSTEMTVVDNINDVQFKELFQPVAPWLRIGLAVTLRAKDPETGSLISVSATLSDPPQM